MSQPGLEFNEVQGNIGTLPGEKLFAAVGTAEGGPIGVPAAFAKVKDVQAAFIRGPLVEFGAHFITTYNRPIVLCRTAANVEGDYLGEVEAADGEMGEIDNSQVTGSAEFSDNSSEPLVTADWLILVITGGTQGTAGIVYQVFKNAVSQGVYALGTDTSITLDGTGISLSISEGTLSAGDIVTFSTIGPIEAAAGELEDSGGGTSAVTIAANTHPSDDYELYLEIVNGGTIGTEGITLRWSLSGGRQKSGITKLGTADYFIFPESGGARFDFSAGTVTAGRVIKCPTLAPAPGPTELGDALDKLKVTTIQWELVHIVNPLAADAFDAVDVKIRGMVAGGRDVAWLGSARLPVGEESEASYLASLSAEFGDKATTFGGMCAGACKLTSGVSSRTYRRPFAWSYAAREGSVAEHIDTADINLGPLPGCSIRDENGNTDEHDESANPGLDDARFTVARTWDGYASGVYVNRPRVFSSDGDDIFLLPHRRVLNLAKSALRKFLVRRLNRPVVVNRKTGRILETEALEIESGANAAVAAVLREAPKASGWRVTISRTDNLLATRKLTGGMKLVPLAYPENAEIDTGFENPAANLLTA